MANKHEEKDQHYKTLYGSQDETKENDNVKNIQNVKRPQTAKRVTKANSRRNLHKSYHEYSERRSLSRKRSENTLAKVYGEQNDKLLAYEREKELIRKRDETKAELKALLKRYMGQQRVENLGGRDKCSQIVGQAQVEMDGMHLKMDKAVYQFNHLDQECNNDLF